jgi:hypothetical protein
MKAHSDQEIMEDQTTPELVRKNQIGNKSAQPAAALVIKAGPSGPASGIEGKEEKFFKDRDLEVSAEPSRLHAFCAGARI